MGSEGSDYDAGDRGFEIAESGGRRFDPRWRLVSVSEVGLRSY